MAEPFDLHYLLLPLGGENDGKAGWQRLRKLTHGNTRNAILRLRVRLAVNHWLRPHPRLGPLVAHNGAARLRLLAADRPQ